MNYFIPSVRIFQYIPDINLDERYGQSDFCLRSFQFKNGLSLYIQGVFQKFPDFFRKKATNNYFCKIYLLASK